MRCLSTRWVRLGAAVGAVAAALLPGSQPVTAQPAGPQFGFSGSASADGVRIMVNVPGAPVSDTPVDGGGPTAQVAMDSVGSSTGYAAFPDPGGLALSAPGLVVGLLSGGAAGLPPIKLPSPPDYPLYVKSDAASNPLASVGSGPYQLSTTSDSTSSKAQSSAGFQSGLSGNAALVSSLATATASDAGAVAKAVADMQGFTVGPLTLGEVKSTATEALDSTGSTVTPSTSLEIAGLRIGGVPVELAPQGLVAGGPSYPLPINATLNGLLKASGITVQVVAAQTFGNRIVAPTVQVTFPFAMPFKIPNVGQYSGTATVTIGLATAEMSGAQSEAGSASAALGGTGGGATPPGEAAPFGAGSEASSSPAVGSTPASTGSLSPPALAASPPMLRPGGVRTRPATLVASTDVDVRSMYLLFVAGAIVALAAGLLIRRLGGQA